jgi:hypothetical protein
MSNARRCRPLAEAWREFNAKFTSPNYYGWHAFEKHHKLLAEKWRCQPQNTNK